MQRVLVYPLRMRLKAISAELTEDAVAEVSDHWLNRSRNGEE